MVLLQELLPGLAQPPQLYDPAFSPLDCRLLQQMGFGVIPVNEEGRRSIGGQRTLFFLPHCEVGRAGRQVWGCVCVGSRGGLMIAAAAEEGRVAVLLAGRKHQQRELLCKWQLPLPTCCCSTKQVVTYSQNSTVAAH